MVRGPRVGFIHVPRTGGTWIQQALWYAGLGNHRWCCGTRTSYLPRDHLLAGHNRKPGLYDVRWRFAFVRYPLAYYESVWKWLVSQKQQIKIIRPYWRWHPFMVAHKVWMGCTDFNDWVQKLLDVEPCWYTRLIEGYVGPEGGEFVEYIGRTESLAQDFVNLCLLMKADRSAAIKAATRPPVNNIDKQVVWTEETKRLVMDHERVIQRRFYGENEGVRFYGLFRQRYFAKVVAPLVEGAAGS